MDSLDKLLRTLKSRLGDFRGPTSAGYYNFARCPYADHSKKFVFGVNPGENTTWCMGCARGGSLADLGLSGKYPKEASPRMALPPLEIRQNVDPETLPFRFVTTTGSPGTAEAAARAYLAYRGVPLDHAVARRVGYGTAGVWRGMTIHPWFDDFGNLGGWQGRVMGNPLPGDPKCLTSVRDTEDRERDGAFIFSPKEGAVIGLETVQNGRPCVIVEGPYDQLSVSRVCGSVSLLGSEMHDAQATRIIKRSPSEIIVGIDPDKAGAALGIARRLLAMTFTPVKVVEWGTYSGDWSAFKPGEPVDAAFVEAVLRDHTTRFRLGM